MFDTNLTKDSKLHFVARSVSANNKYSCINVLNEKHIILDTTTVRVQRTTNTIVCLAVIYTSEWAPKQLLAYVVKVKHEYYSSFVLYLIFLR